jgi:predicted Zn-dependent protease
MQMKYLHRAGALVISAALFAPASVLAVGQDAAKSDKAKAPAARGALDEKENPEMIGKRNINKGIIGGGSLEKEVALGAQLAAQVGQQAQFVEDPVITEYVNRVGQNIVLHSDAKVAFTIKVIDSDDVNAFALPGGFFFVNKGVLLAADSEAELAGVMAHEIAHVAARHGMENARKGQILNWATIPLIFIGGGIGYAVQSAAQILVPMGFLKFSRNAENEADLLGAQYMWASGYDPNAMVDFFKKLEGKETKKPGTLAKVFRTHPLTSDREAKVAALVARFPNKPEYIYTTSEFDRVKARLLSLSNVPMATGAPSEAPGSKRPTLTRRQPTDVDNPPDPMDPANTPAPTDRPKLERRDQP